MYFTFLNKFGLYPLQTTIEAVRVRSILLGFSSVL